MAKEDDELLAEQERLGPEDSAMIEAAVHKEKKSITLAYVLLVFLGCVGVHKFYLGQRNWGIAYLVLWLIAFCIFEAQIALEDVCLKIVELITLGLAVDLFLIPGQVAMATRKHRLRLIEQCVEKQRQAKSG